PRFRFKTVALDDWSRIVDVVRVEVGALDGSEVRYVDGRRAVRGMEEIAAPSGSSMLTRGGVYLIAGGAGALGGVVADYLKREWHAQVVSMSRSGADDGAFIRGDVTSASDVRAAVATVLDRFGRLNGVFHCAGVLRDGLARHKSDADFSAVVAAK